jgi:hypothetical protein
VSRDQFTVAMRLEEFLRCFNFIFYFIFFLISTLYKLTLIPRIIAVEINIIAAAL